MSLQEWIEEAKFLVQAETSDEQYRKVLKDPRSAEMFRKMAEAGKTANETNSLGADWDESEPAMRNEMRPLLLKILPELAGSL